MQRITSLSIAALLLGAAGCARQMPPDPAAAPAERVLVADADGTNIRSINSTGPVAADVKASPQAAYRALVTAYGELGIAPEVTDEASLRVARTNFTARRIIAGERASVYFECGESLTGSRADEGRLTVSLASQATPGPAGATVATTLTAVVRANDGTSTGATSCSSTGRLETRIHNLVKQRATI